ncbi:hypothetical protein DS2_18573 [Catenovulum agarivorans DS-2]|uniref:DUF1289 domain-containing protein n=1 Tax=Catenovulum agarivorans DS-2 TaxID=1328313 RepID=W7QGY6_9ALTE|nr:DUF1289 domain-containing protein [Catenovulum agarivorans]EWH08202.1 hypothetical protein DS2_18573 [Catenovulum agarivorans DS-2]
MQQASLFEIDVKSPCIHVCESGPRGYCRGCLRSREERFYWEKLTAPQKLQVIQLCELRKKRLNSKIAKEKEQKLLTEIKNQQLDLF